MTIATYKERRPSLITVHVLDSENYELNTDPTIGGEGYESIKEAKTDAQRFLRDPEMLKAGMSKVEIRLNGSCHTDYFPKGPQCSECKHYGFHSRSCNQWTAVKLEA